MLIALKSVNNVKKCKFRNHLLQYSHYTHSIYQNNKLYLHNTHSHKTLNKYASVQTRKKLRILLQFNCKKIACIYHDAKNWFILSVLYHFDCTSTTYIHSLVCPKSLTYSWFSIFICFFFLAVLAYVQCKYYRSTYTVNHGHLFGCWPL